MVKCSRQREGEGLTEVSLNLFVPAGFLQFGSHGDSLTSTRVYLKPHTCHQEFYKSFKLQTKKLFQNIDIAIHFSERL